MRQGPLLKPIALTFSAIKLVRAEISRAATPWHHEEEKRWIIRDKQVYGGR
jgi:hypothetical protein